MLVSQSNRIRKQSAKMGEKAKLLITTFCILLFALPFVRQLPHFWAGIRMLEKDYSKAGFRLLPSINGKRSNESTITIFVSALILIPICVYIMAVGYVGLFLGFLILSLNLNFLFQAYALLKTRDIKEARRVKFGSLLPFTGLAIGVVLAGVSRFKSLDSREHPYYLESVKHHI